MWSVHHTELSGRIFPVVATTTCAASIGHHQDGHLVLNPPRNSGAYKGVSSLPGFDGVINVAQGRWVTNSAIWAIVMKVFAVQASNANLTHNDLAPM